MTNLSRLLPPLAAPFMLAACTVGPNHTPPQPTLPGAFSSLPASGALSSTPTAEGPAPRAVSVWWEHLGDPMLTSLVQRGTEGNLDLRIAAERVREARALRDAAAGRRMPQVSAGAGATRSRASQTTAGSFGSADGTTLFDVGVDASWELDVFGGIRREVQAADADLAAAEESRRGVLVTLAAEIASTYAEYRGLQQRADLARRTIDAQQSTLELTRARVDAGIAPDIDNQQALAQLSTRRSQLPALEAAARQSAHRLGVLLGLPPAAVMDELSSPGAIPVPPAIVEVGVPASLVRQRPDIRAAERALAAATARVGVATAELYPTFQIGARAGVQSRELASLPDSNSATFSVGPQVRWNLYTGGRVRAQIEAAGARQRQALLAFDRTVLAALEEVENALTDFVHEQRRRDHLASAVDANRRAVSLAEERWKSGIGDFLSVLINQRELFDSEDQLVQNQLQVTRALVRVYKSLGGGWDMSAPAPAGGAEPARPGATPASDAAPQG
jgi:outer membrane protein, multidrug efflux system